MATLESSTGVLPTPRAVPMGGPSLYFKLLNFTLRDFFRSIWALFVLAVLVAIHLMLFDVSPSRSHFFGVQYASTILVAGITAAGMFTRANRAEMLPILARPVSRVAVASALMLGAWLVAIVAYLLSSAVVLVRYGSWFEGKAPVDRWLDISTFVYGSLPMLAIGLLSVSVVALLSTFVSPSVLRLIVLALIALLIMSFDNRNFPIVEVRSALQALPPVMAPVAGALRYATEASRDTVATVSLAMLAGYAFFLALAVLLLSAARETVLD
ncbi:MAG TPA: hypothetical protein VJ183_10100 [Chloroflexia bacterium]|nr:hypothetical protein [Chloroflexia bacterium]